VGSERGWLGVVVARQADLSGSLGATGRCTLTGGVLEKQDTVGGVEPWLSTKNEAVVLHVRSLCLCATYLNIF